MHLAILSDVHGNLPAFETVLKHVAQQRPDQIILIGDIVVGSPDSLDCWRLAQSLGCPMLRGNHERYVAPHVNATPPLQDTQQFAPVHWALAQLSAQDRALMGELPLTLRLPDAPDLLLVHASMRSDMDTVASHTPEAQLQAMFPDITERFIIRAHNHVGQVRLWEDRFIVTNGSVGLALDGNATAQYLLLDQSSNGWHIQHQSVPYDLEAVVRRFHDTGYLKATGPMGQLFLREVVTATQQLVPFVRLYNQWSQATALTLEEALKRFLNEW